MNKFIKKYSHAWTLLYVLIYFPWFIWLEQRKATYTMVHSSLDSLIPFSEYFAIPYFLWFIYVPIITLLILLKGSKENFYRFSAMLFLGMTICLIIYTIWPNAQPLRVNLDVDKNIFTRLISTLYKADTATNVFPSIHVYNSLVCHIALCRVAYLKDKKLIKSLSFIIMLLICLSTIFLKQHSLLDGLASLVLCSIMYIFVYQYSLIKSNKFLKKPVSSYEDSSTNSAR